MYCWEDVRSLRCVLVGGREVTTMCTVGRTWGHNDVYWWEDVRSLRCVLLEGREVTTMCTGGRT